MNLEQVKNRIKAHIKKHFDGNQAAFARHLGIERQNINNILSGRSPIPKTILDEIGVVKTIGYRLKR